MNSLKVKARDAVNSVRGFVSGARSVMMMALVLLSASFASAAGEYDTLTSGLETEIGNIKTVLIGLGATIIGVSVVFLVVRFVKRMISG